MTTWNFIETALYQAIPNFGVGLALPLPSGTQAELTFSETALERGAIAFDYVGNDSQGIFGHVVPGSDTDFSFHTPIAGQFGAAVNLPYSATCCDVSAHLALSVTPEAISGLIDFQNDADNLHMTIADNIVSLAYVAADWTIFGCSAQCYVSGYWADPAPVTRTPEPGFIGSAMIATALIVAVLVHRNRALQVRRVASHAL